jgi:histidyl-tRNA synthetase
VFIAYFDRTHRDDYLRLATNLRRAGIGVEVYPDAKKLGVQLKYAAAHGFAIALIAGGSEWSESRCQLKTLASKETEDVPYSHDQPDQLTARIETLLRM